MVVVVGVMLMTMRVLMHDEYVSIATKQRKKKGQLNHKRERG